MLIPVSNYYNFYSLYKIIELGHNVKWHMISKVLFNVIYFR